MGAPRIRRRRERRSGAQDRLAQPLFTGNEGPVHAFAAIVMAAQSTAWEQLQRVPKQTWINLGICVLAVLVVVRVWRLLKRFNDYAPYLAAVFSAVIIFCYWVYERTEPRFLTPLVNKLAPFFPSKAQQERDLETVRRGRDV
jgi:hypothetical protein